MGSSLESFHLTQRPRTVNLGELKRTGWQPKRLNDKHKAIIALHAQAVRREDISRVCGCTPEFVSMVVRTDLAKAYLAQLEEHTDGRLRQLYGASVDAIDSGLHSDDEEIKLKAARLQLEASGKMKGDQRDNRTAEDLVASILAQATVIIGNNIQVNQHNGAPVLPISEKDE